jgi:ABC-2 type transport system permease protein
MFAIARREFYSLFASPLAWSLLGLMQLILGMIFILRLSLIMQPEIQSQLATTPNAPSLTDAIAVHLFVWTGILLIFTLPLLTMRLISEERQNKTLVLLLSAPVSMSSIVLGKYFGLMFFLSLLLLMVALMPLSLMFNANLDIGQLMVAWLGLWLFSAALAAIGLYISAMANNPSVAAIITFGVFLLLWIIDWASEYEEYGALLSYLSITRHYQILLDGLISSSDIIYYIIIILIFNILTIHRLDAQRLR